MISNNIVSNNSQAINVGPVTCGTNESLTNYNCVEMGDVTIYGEKTNGVYPNATYINSITSYNDSNGIYINSNIVSDDGYAIYTNGGLSGAGALFVKGNMKGKTAIRVMGSIEGTSGSGIDVSDVKSTGGYAIYANMVTSNSIGI